MNTYRLPLRTWLFVLISVITFRYGDVSAQGKVYRWVSYDTTQSEIDTTVEGMPAQYVQQYDTLMIEKLRDSRLYIWIRTMALSGTHKVNWHEHSMMADSLFSNYNYAACQIEIDYREYKFRTWQWMYYDERDDPVSGLKLNRERPMAWYPLTPSLKKMVQKLGI
ncbi:MAG: hypothetical protein Q8916_14395 [Bacteroidota bacterium]|nr:hypothetical protein [Bacteroidota bacterium]MDP4231585.1 hypothetical protein [Bacteroidota bacterium]MDP4237389.1 hypothetical protein [Bacteroidota bacterium]